MHFKTNTYKVRAVVPIPQMSLYCSTMIPSFLRFMTRVNISAREAGLAPTLSTVCCVLPITLLLETNRSFLKNKIPKAKEVLEKVYTTSHIAAAWEIQSVLSLHIKKRSSLNLVFPKLIRK